MKAIIITLLFLLYVQPVYADRALKLKKMSSEQRVALVIGNNEYKTMQPLKNPVNDARAMKKALEGRGFDVIYKENATKRDMKKLVKRFTKQISRGGVGMYFYAGHGVNSGGRNYLAGIDSVMTEEEDVEYEALALDYIVTKIKKAGNRLNMVVLDACRNNPFGRSGGGGLAPIGNAKGLFVAYATEAGSVASDNKKGRNGLFTKHLLSSIDKPGANLAAVFKDARRGVFEESNGRQSPGVYDQTLGEFYFTLPDKSTTAGAKEDIANNYAAVVIGNSNYGPLSSIPNAKNDAIDMATILKVKGFDVSLHSNADKNGVFSSIKNVFKKNKNTEVFLLYFAGHGFMNKGEDYILPVGVDFDTIKESMMSVGEVFSFVKKSFKLKGYAPGNESSVFVYATSKGGVASDGDKGNGTFTNSFLKVMEYSSLDLGSMLESVKRSVVRESGNVQIPEFEINLKNGDEFSFGKKKKMKAPVIIFILDMMRTVEDLG